MTESSAEHRWGHGAGAHLSSVLICLLCTTAWSGQTADEDFEVGQQWVYRHQGPRPGDVEPNVIDGERIVQVISTADGQGVTPWVIEERFTNSKDVIGRLHVNQERMLILVEGENRKGEVATFRYDPPIPHTPRDLAVGEKRKIETTLRMESVEFSLPIAIVTERLEDETISTPAGEFDRCYHCRTTTTSTVNIRIAKIPITEEREQWHHPRAGGMVKEVYRRGPVKFLTWSRDGYTATSVLTAFGKEEVKSSAQSASAVDANDGPARQSEGPASDHSLGGGIALMLAGTAVVLGIGMFLRFRRKKRLAKR